MAVGTPGHPSAAHDRRSQCRRLGRLRRSLPAGRGRFLHPLCRQGPEREAQSTRPDVSERRSAGCHDRRVPPESHYRSNEVNAHAGAGAARNWLGYRAMKCAVRPVGVPGDHRRTRPGRPPSRGRARRNGPVPGDACSTRPGPGRAGDLDRRDPRPWSEAPADRVPHRIVSRSRCIAQRAKARRAAAWRDDADPRLAPRRRPRREGAPATTTTSSARAATSSSQ